MGSVLCRVDDRDVDGLACTGVTIVGGPVAANHDVRLHTAGLPVLGAPPRSTTHPVMWGARALLQSERVAR